MSSSVLRARVPLALGAVAVLVAILACASATRSASDSTARPATASRVHPRLPAVVRTPALTPGSLYLALGDSNSFGYAEANAVPVPDYAHPSRLVGFPEIIGRTARVNVANASCPGETSGSLIDTRTPSNACESSAAGRGYRSWFPLHVSYGGSQLAYAVRYVRTHRRTRLVSLMIGANDLERCDCGTTAALAALDADVSANVARILRALRRAGYRGQIVLVNNYVVDYHTAYRDSTTSLNRATDASARRFGAEIADGYGAFYARARAAGDDACAAGLITRLGDGSCGGHPSAAGQALLAGAVLHVIRR